MNTTDKAENVINILVQRDGKKLVNFWTGAEDVEEAVDQLLGSLKNHSSVTADHNREAPANGHIAKWEAKATETPKHTVFLTFPDGSIRSFPGGVTGIDVAESISKTLAKRTVAVSLNGKIIAASDVLESGRIEIICSGDPRANVTEALNAAHKAVCAELRTRLGDGFVVLRELEPNSDVKDVVKFVNALNEGTASTETPAKVFTRKDMKRVNFLTGEGVAEAKEKAISILLDTYRADIALFAKQVFGAKLTPEQITFCEEFRTERTITRHEPPAWGKTYVAAIAVWWSLICFDDVRVSIFGPCESAIKVGLWRQVLELHARMAEPFKDMFDISATRISRKTDAASCFAEYRIVSADNASAARGIHAVNNFVFVDDADGVSEIVIAYLMNIMIDPNPKLCLLSTKMNAKFASLRDLKLYALANFTKSYPEDVAKLILNVGLYDEFTTMVQAKETW